MSLLFISLLFPLVLIAGLRVFAAFVLFTLILPFFSLCQTLVRILTLSCFFLLLMSFFLLFDGLIATSFLVYFILRFLFNRRFRLLVLFILFVFVLGRGSIFDVFLYFNNGLNYVIGCDRRLLLLFLLAGARQECCHHVVALGGPGIACSLLLLFLLFVILLGFSLEFFHFLLCYGGGRDFLRSWLWLLVLFDHHLLDGCLLSRFYNFLFSFW